MDTRGLDNYEHIKINSGRNPKESRSANRYGKRDKARGLRRIADRHGHHRRRIIITVELDRSRRLNYEEELVMPVSTTCAQKRQGLTNFFVDHLCTNRKGR